MSTETESGFYDGYLGTSRSGENLETPERGEDNPVGSTESGLTQGNQSPTQKVSFYTEKEGDDDKDVNYGCIRKPKHAEDVAYIAANHGINKAILREKALQREVETGFTAKQEYNNTIKNDLLDKYKGIVLEVLLPDGKTAAFIPPIGLKGSPDYIPAQAITDDGWLSEISLDEKEISLQHFGPRGIMIAVNKSNLMLQEQRESGYNSNGLSTDFLVNGEGYKVSFKDLAFHGWTESQIQDFASRLRELPKQSSGEEENLSLQERAKRITDLL